MHIFKEAAHTRITSERQQDRGRKRGDKSVRHMKRARGKKSRRRNWRRPVTRHTRTKFWPPKVSFDTLILHRLRRGNPPVPASSASSPLSHNAPLTLASPSK